MNAKHLQLICILLLPSTPLLITLKCTLNIFATAGHHSMQKVISARAGGVHHRCALTPFVWAVHTNEGCKVYTINILLRNIVCNNTADV